MINDLGDLRKLLEMCSDSGVTQMRVGSVEFSIGPKPIDLEKLKKAVDKVKLTDEEILFNPYHGME